MTSLPLIALTRARKVNSLASAVKEEQEILLVATRDEKMLILGQRTTI